MSTIPENIGDLKKLKELVLRGNIIESLPNSLKSCTKLETLDLSSNRISIFPPIIRSLINLKSLYMQYNDILTIPDTIGNLSNLKVLNLNNNRIQAIPGQIGNAFRLERLYIGNNQISEIPDTIGHLYKLNDLSLINNQISTVTESVGNLLSLKRLFLKFNLITSIPDSIANLINLKELDLGQNRFSLFPESICNLYNLEFLSLSNNQITELPENIKHIPNSHKLFLLGKRFMPFTDESSQKQFQLRELYLDNNQISFVPNTFDRLESLNSLGLSGNKIKFLPSCFRNMDNLILLRLHDNNELVEYGDGENLGLTELLEIFGDHLDVDISRSDIVEIKEDKVIEDMKLKEIYWNLDTLKSIKTKTIKQCDMLDTQMIKIIQKCSNTKLISSDDQDDLIEYVHMLFDTKYKYSKWPMIEKYIPLARGLIGNILEYLEKKIDSNDTVSINFGLSDIAEGTRYCPDRQMAELKKAYSALNGNVYSELDSFVYQMIATLKERIFDLTVTPNEAYQNVHVLNYWKYEMRETLGFDFEFKSNLGTMDQDPFHGFRGNALSAFLTKFSPSYVISALTDSINDKKEVMYELMNIIHRDETLNDSDKAIFNEKEPYN